MNVRLVFPPCINIARVSTFVKQNSNNLDVLSTNSNRERSLRLQSIRKSKLTYLFPFVGKIRVTMVFQQELGHVDMIQPGAEM